MKNQMKKGEFVHLNVFKRQTEVIYGQISTWVILQIHKWMCIWCNVETLLKPEMIFVNPVFKCCVATWLMTDLCVNVHKTDFTQFKKMNLKDEKQELGRIDQLWIHYCCCVK